MDSEILNNENLEFGNKDYGSLYIGGDLDFGVFSMGMYNRLPLILYLTLQVF